MPPKQKVASILPLRFRDNRAKGGEALAKYRIAVEDGLTQIEAALRQEGYQVVDPDESGSNVDAMVITGMDENLMGITDTLLTGVVIDATDLDANEVLSELERRLPKKEQ